jgi:hypothetical protein
MNMIYAGLTDAPDKFYRIVGFDEYSADNIHIYLFGIKKKRATVIGEFPQKTIQQTSSILNVKYEWEELIPINKELAYFSLHPQDMVFRIQYKDGTLDHIARADRSIYEAGRTMFQMNLQTDSLAKYTAHATKFRHKHFTIGVDRAHPYIELQSYISKNEGEALRQVIGDANLHPKKRDILTSKGPTITTATDFRLNEKGAGIAMPNRPDGAFVVMFFRTGIREYITKAFLVA